MNREEKKHLPVSAAGSKMGSWPLSPSIGREYVKDPSSFFVKAENRLDMKKPGRTNVEGMPELRMYFSMSALPSK